MEMESGWSEELKVDESDAPYIVKPFTKEIY